MDDLITRAINENWDEDQVDRRFLRQAYRNLQGAVEPNHRARGDVVERSTMERRMSASLLLRFGLDPTSTVFRSEFGRSVLSTNDQAWLIRGARQIREDGSGNLSEEMDAAFNEAHRLRHVPLLDVCRHVLESQGIRCSSYSREEIFQRAVSTASLANIFTTVFNSRLVAGFMDVTDTSDGVVAVGEDLPNFQVAERVRMGLYSRLERRARGKDPNDGTIDADKYNARVYEYASSFSIDESDAIDDRFGKLESMSPEEMGKSARLLQPELVYSLLLSNPTMADGNALFQCCSRELVLQPSTDG